MKQSLYIMLLHRLFKINLVIALVLFSHTICKGQDDPQKIIDQFFDRYSKKDADDALGFLFSTNKFMEGSKEQVENVKQKLSHALNVVGDFRGHELISKKCLGSRYCLYTYIVFHDRQPLRFSMVFYRPDKWQLMNFSFEDNLDDELIEASKAYRLTENLPH